MDKFIKCPSCGTRNFSDDLRCGICNTSLKYHHNVEKVNGQLNTKPNYFIIGLVVFIIAVFAYNNHYENSKVNSQLSTPQGGNVETKSLSYSLLEIELNNKRAFNISVRIDEKLTDNQLINLSQKVIKEIKVRSNKGVVFFFLPNMKLNNGAWAAVDYEPNISVRIIGQSLVDESLIKSGLENITDYYGLWADEGSKGDVIIRIRKDKVHGYVFEFISPTDPSPSEFASPLRKSTFKGKTIFKDIEHPEQFFLLEDNGNLSVYDNYGFVVRYKRLK